MSGAQIELSRQIVQGYEDAAFAGEGIEAEEEIEGIVFILLSR